jgi:hypothetical protein
MQMQNNVIAETYNKKLAHKGMVILGYALPLIAPFWAIVKAMSRNSAYTINDLFIMVIPVLLALMIALWIALKRVLSRHNSAFILIISLFCCFPIASGVASDKDLRYELMSMLGIEPAIPETDPSLDSESEPGSSEMTADEVRERLRKEEERIRRENVERLRTRDASPETLGQ